MASLPKYCDLLIRHEDARGSAHSAMTDVFERLLG